MIRYPSKDEMYCIEQRLGPMFTKYFLEMVDTINQHIGNTERHINTARVLNESPMYSSSVNPPEESHAREETKEQRSGEGLPRTEPGK